MEERYGEHTLLAAVRRCVGPVEVVLAATGGVGGAVGGAEAAGQQHGGATTGTKKSDGAVTFRVPYFLRHCCTCLSVKAFSHVLCALSSALSRQLLEELVYRKTFTEWGAMLLYQEVSSCCWVVVVSACLLAVAFFFCIVVV